MRVIGLFCALLLLASCSKGDGTPERRSDAPTPPIAAASQEVAPPASTRSDREAVLGAILGPQDFGSYQVRSAYDLGAIRMATLGRVGDAQPITVLSVAATEAGFTPDELDLAFRTASGDGASEHPLELLGYDLIQPKSVSNLVLGARSMPSLTYAWLRVAEDSGVRENGVGSTVWMHCGSKPGPVGDRFVFASSEMPAGKYDEARLGEFVRSLSWCGK